jgi:hypothetical protein
MGKSHTHPIVAFVAFVAFDSFCLHFTVSPSARVAHSHLPSHCACISLPRSFPMRAIAPQRSRTFPSPCCTAHARILLPVFIYADGLVVIHRDNQHFVASRRCDAARPCTNLSRFAIYFPYLPSFQYIYSARGDYVCFSPVNCASPSSHPLLCHASLCP